MMVKGMEKENICMPMDQLIKEIGRMVKNMEMEYVIGMNNVGRVIVIRENGNMIFYMEKENIFMPMDQFIKVILSKMLQMEKVN